MYAELGFLQYRLKSPMLLAIVDHVPIEAVVADMKAMNRYLPGSARTLMSHKWSIEVEEEVEEYSHCFLHQIS